MSEAWRRKRYYKTRVLIDTERILDTSFQDVILCLSGAQVEMVRNLCAYLHRRSTFAEQYTKAGYLAPSSEDWIAIETIVGDLEEKLMGDLCADLLTAIQEQAASVALMQACLCQMKESSIRENARLPPLEGYVDESQVTYKTETETRGAPDAPATDEAKCELAQAFYYYIYDLYTEDLLPFANGTADSITTTITAGSAFLGLALFIGLPVAILAIIAATLVAWAIDGSIANFTNFLLSAKDDIVCIAYRNYPDYDATAAAYKLWIEAQGSISYLDKAVLRTVLASAWHMSWVSQLQQDEGTYDDRLLLGQCDTCTLLPLTCHYVGLCNLDDWENGTVECLAGRANIIASWSYYTPNQITIPGSGSPILTFAWTPRNDLDENGRCSYGLWDTVSEQLWNVETTIYRPANVLAIETGNIPSQTWGHACHLWVKQEAHKAEPLYWCVDLP